MQIVIPPFLRTDFFKDSFWALLGSVVLRGASLVTSIMLAHILLKTTFGEFNSLKNTLTTLAVFTTFGLGYTSTKFVADYINSKNKNPANLISQIYTITLVFSCAVSALLFIFAEDISYSYYKNTGFLHEIRLLALWVIITAISTAQNGIIAGLGIFKQLAKVNILIGVATVIVLPGLAYFHGLFGACLALVFIQGINCLFNYILIKNELKTTAKNEEDVGTRVNLRQILNYSLPLTLIEAVFSIFLWVNYFMLQNYQNYDEVALYSAAMQWYVVLLFIPTVLRNVILSYFSKNDSTYKITILRNAVTISLVATLLPAVVIFACAPYIASLYGGAFSGLTSVLRVIVFIPVFSSVINVLEQFLFSISKNWLVFFVCLLKDSFTSLLFIYFLLVKDIHQGAVYLSLAYLIMNLLVSLLYLIIYFKTDLFSRYLNFSTKV